MPVEPGGAELPAGTVTFLLTDIEGSTRLWESVPEAMEVALERHNRLLAERDRGAWRGGGHLPRGGGQFLRRVSQRGFRGGGGRGVPASARAVRRGRTGAALRVRMGLHTGEARCTASDHVDHAPINRCARVKAAGARRAGAGHQDHARPGRRAGWAAGSG